MLAALMLILCLAGGASRATELGQVVVRIFSVVVLMILCMTRRTWRVGDATMPLIVVAALAAVGLAQLIPLPPALWTVLPGRNLFEAAIPAGVQPWRPINLTPDAGLNAVLSLTVPLAVGAILAGCSRSDRNFVADILLAAIVLAALLSSLQFSGGGANNPFINDAGGEAAGVFANRNHQALLLACGLPLACSWGLRGDRGNLAARMAVAAALAIWFLFLILAIGSRAGFLLAIGGFAAAVVLIWMRLQHLRIRGPRWLVSALLVASVIIIGTIVALAMSSDRALSLQRLLATSEGRDLRARSLPHMWDLAVLYFPVGSGLGSFDPVFRVIEPDDLLSLNYLNHAHNEPVELIIETGLLGLVPLGLILTFWVRLGRHSWRDARAGGSTALSAWSILSLILLASLVDYPLRTPLVMTVAVCAAWLSRSCGQYRVG